MADEFFASKLYGQYGSAENKFWTDKFDASIIGDIARWVKQVDPNAETVLTEDYIIEKSYDPKLYNLFMQNLKNFKQNGAPIDAVCIENNLWIFDPPSKSEMTTVLAAIHDLGYIIAPPETTVVVSETFPTWEQRPRKVQSIANKDLAQGELYKMLAEAYAPYKVFGYAGYTDKKSWYTDIGKPDANPNILDINDKPKIAYYMLLQAFSESIK